MSLRLDGGLPPITTNAYVAIINSNNDINASSSSASTTSETQSVLDDNINSLALEDIEELEKDIRKNQLIIANSTPSLYSKEKSDMIKSSAYYYDFLSQKRPNLGIEINSKIQNFENKLNDMLKLKIRQAIDNRASKVFKNLIPSTEHLKEQEKEQEIKQFKSDLQQFQTDYKEIVENYKKNTAPLDSQIEPLWENLLKDKQDPVWNKPFKMKNKKGEEEELSRDDMLEFLKKIFTKQMTKKGLSEAKGSLIKKFHNDEWKNYFKEDAKEETILKMAKCIEKKDILRKEKNENLKQLYENLKTKHSAFLENILDVESQIVTDLFEELAQEHQAHTFGRFTKLFSCHADFVNNMIHFLEGIKSKDTQPKNIQDIVVEMFSKVYLDPSEKDNKERSTRDARFYRDIQGKIEGQKSNTDRDKLFDNKMGFVFNQAMRNLFTKREDSHTIPFPGAFSWKMEKLQEKLITQPFKRQYITKTAFDRFKPEGDNTKLLQEIIDQLKQDNPSDEKKFICEALLVIIQLALIQASETETMPSFINQNLDQLSEAKLKAKDKSNQSSSKGMDDDYKKILAENLIKLIQHSKKTDFAGVFKENEDYIKQILTRLKSRISQLSTNRSVEKVSLKGLYELRLICDIWAALEHVENKAKHPISSSLSPKWDDLTEWAGNIPAPKEVDKKDYSDFTIEF